MADIPIYEQKNQYEERSAPEVYSSYEHMASAFQQFSEALQQPVQIYAKTRAAEKGALEGMQKDYSPEGLPLTPVAYAERAAAIQAHTNVIDMDIKNKVSELYAQHASTITPDSLKNFQTNLASWSSAYLESMPDVFKAQAQLTLQQYASSAQSRIVSSLASMTQKNLAADIKSGFDQQIQQVMSVARSNPDQAQGLYNQMLANATELRKRNVIDESYFNQIRFSDQNQLNEEKQLGYLYQAVGKGQIMEWKDSVQNDSSLNQLQKDSVLAKGDAIISRLQSQMNGKDVMFEQELQKNLQTVNQTGQVNTAIQSVVDNKTNMAAAVNYALDQHTSATLGNLAYQAKYSPNSSVDALVDSIKIDPNDPGALQKQQVKSGLQNWNHQRNQLIQGDPAGYFNDSPIVSSAVDAAKTASYSDEATHENVPFYKLSSERQGQVLLSARINARLAEQKQFGITQDKLSALTNQEALGFVQTIKSLPLDQQPFAISSYLQSFDHDQAYYVTKDLQKNGLPMASQYLLKMMSNDASRPYLADAAIAWSHMGSGKENTLSDYEPILKVKDLKGWGDLDNQVMSNSTVQQFQKALASSGVNSAPIFHDYTEHVKVLAAQLMSKGSSVSDAISTASQAILPDIQFHSIRGNTFLAPNEISDATLKDAHAFLLHQAVNSELHLNPTLESFLGHIPGAQALVKKVIFDLSHLSTTSDQRGLELVSPTGERVLDKDGKPFQVLFKDMMDPTSEFHKNSSDYRIKSLIPNITMKTSLSDLIQQSKGVL